MENLKNNNNVNNSIITNSIEKIIENNIFLQMKIKMKFLN